MNHHFRQDVRVEFVAQIDRINIIARKIRIHDSFNVSRRPPEVSYIVVKLVRSLREENLHE